LKDWQRFTEKFTREGRASGAEIGRFGSDRCKRSSDKRERAKGREREAKLLRVSPSVATIEARVPQAALSRKKEREREEERKIVQDLEKCGEAVDARGARAME